MVGQHHDPRGVVSFWKANNFWTVDFLIGPVSAIAWFLSCKASPWIRSNIVQISGWFVLCWLKSSIEVLGETWLEVQEVIGKQDTFVPLPQCDQPATVAGWCPWAPRLGQQSELFVAIRKQGFSGASSGTINVEALHGLRCHSHFHVLSDCVSKILQQSYVFHQKYLVTFFLHSFQ